MYPPSELSDVGDFEIRFNSCTIGMMAEHKIFEGKLTREAYTKRRNPHS